MAEFRDTAPLRGVRTGEPVYQRPITAQASAKKYSFKRQLHCGKVVANGWEPHAKQFSHGMRMEIGSEKLTCVPKYFQCPL